MRILSGLIVTLRNLGDLWAHVPEYKSGEIPDGVRQQIEHHYREQEREETIHHSKLGCLLATVLVPLASYVLDHFMYPSQFWHFLVYRIICSALTLVNLAILNTDWGRRHYRIFCKTWFILPALIISCMIYEADQPETPYYAGLCLVIIATSTLLPWSATLNRNMACGLTLTYAAIMVCRGWFVREFANNMFFLGSISLVCIISCYVHRQFHFREFVERFQLARSRETVSELLERSQIKYQILFSLAGDALLVVQDQKIADCNLAAQEMFRGSRDTLVGLNIATLLPEKEVRQKLLFDDVETAGLERFDFPCKRRDGSRFEAEVVSNRLPQKRVLLVVRDISERKLAQQQLETSRAQLRELFSRADLVVEKERQRISRDLHDNLGQLLTAHTMVLHSIQRRLAPLTEGDAVLRERVGSAVQLTSEMRAQVQQIAKGLRPTILRASELLDKMRAALADLSRLSDIEVQCAFPEDLPSLDEIQATVTFRVFQEALTNITRHAQATTITVRIWFSAASLLLEVADDGIGLPLNAELMADSIGLVGMQERAAIIGGSVTFRRNSPQGTIVHLMLPLQAGTSIAEQSPRLPAV